jgi:hypothetical protein
MVSDPKTDLGYFFYTFTEEDFEFAKNGGTAS